MATAVLTRESVEAYAAALAPLDVVAMPVTRSAPPPDPDAIARALARPYAAIVVASARAAEAVKHAPGEIWAVGPATRRVLAHAIHPDGVRDAAGLARALVAARSLAGARVIVPRAEDGRTEAIEILRAAGAEVDDVIAYRTVAVGAGDPAVAAGRELLASHAAAACCVFAPSQVAALLAIVGPLAGIPTAFCAIGETTAAALRAAGIARPIVAATPTPEGLARAIALHSRPA